MLSLNSLELRIVAALASVFALRMLGLCMLLPVFAIEASKYPHASVQLIGMAIGVYGLAQAVLQIPFGILSDKYGRRPLMFCGLFLMLLGSIIAYEATTIYGLILGRILQGSGAIGSVVIATLADNTREQIRTQAMAILGISIGLAFVVAMVLGPWLAQARGLGAVFLLTGWLAVAGLAVLFFTIPKTAARQAGVNVASLKHTFGMLSTNQRLLSLNFGIFALHASLAALFLVLPLLVQRSGFEYEAIWRLYLLTFVVALPVALKFITRAEQQQKIALLQNYAIVGLFVAEALLLIFNVRAGIFIGLSVFFTAFCILEASLPTLVAKHAPVQQRGAALGIYSSLQFLGVFVGGVVGGWLHGAFGVVAVVSFCMLLATAWLLMTFRLRSVVNILET